MERPEIDDKALCSVCIAGLSEDGGHRGVVSTPCGHLFHKECLIQWFQNQSGTGRRARLTELEMERLKGPCPICTSGTWFKRCINIYLNLDDQKKVVGRYVGSMEDKIKAAEKKAKEHEKKVKEQEKQLVKAKEREEIYKKVIEDLKTSKKGTVDKASKTVGPTAGKILSAVKAAPPKPPPVRASPKTTAAKAVKAVPPKQQATKSKVDSGLKTRVPNGATSSTTGTAPAGRKVGTGRTTTVTFNHRDSMDLRSSTAVKKAAAGAAIARTGSRVGK